MNLNELIAEAVRLCPVRDTEAQQYESAQAVMRGLVNEELRARPDVSRLIGDSPLEVMELNHANHAAFMSTVFSLGQYELLARTLPWVYRAYRGQGFSFAYFPVELEAWKRAVLRCLPAGSTGSILAVYDWMLARHEDVIRLASLPGGVGTEAESGVWAERRRRYVQALLDGEPDTALEVARGITTPANLQEFYLQVVQPALYEIGERWETGMVSVATEHMATAITNRVVAALATARPRTKPWRGVAVICSAPSEQHELGAWMLSDLLELDGWRVRYLGANTPAPDLVEMVERQQADLLAVSATMPFYLPGVKAITAAVRARRKVAVMVGGRVFNQKTDLWKEMGADAWANNARDAVLAARRFGKRDETTGS